MDVDYSDLILATAVVFSTAFTIILLTLPSQYRGEQESRTSENEKKFKTSVQIVVLGDIGRSPRMEYHALSIAKNGGRVDIIGVLGMFNMILGFWSY
jgi:beta-1,4-mannosyltransferase